MQKTMFAFMALMGAAAFGRGLSGAASAPVVLGRSAATDSVYLKETAHFALFYSKTGVHAFPQADVDKDGNGVPDVVDDLALEAERIWRLAIDTMGFPAPKGTTKELVSHLDSKGKFTVRIGDLATLSSALGPQGAMGFCTQPGLDSLVPDGMEIVVENDFINSYNHLAFQVKVAPQNTQWKDDSVLYDYSVRPDLGWRVTLAHEFFHALQKQYDKGFYMAFHEMSAVWFAHRVYPTIHQEWQYLQKFALIAEQPAFSYWENEEYAEWPMAKAMALTYGDAFMKQIWDYRKDILVNGGVIDEGTWFHNALTSMGKDESAFNRTFIRMVSCLQLSLACSDDYFDGFQLSTPKIKVWDADSVEDNNSSSWSGGGAFQVRLFKIIPTKLVHGWNAKSSEVTPTSSAHVAVIRLPSQSMTIVKPLGGPYVFNVNPGDTSLYFALIGGYDGVRESGTYVGGTKLPLSTGIGRRRSSLVQETPQSRDLQGRPVTGTHRGITIEFIPGQGWVRRVKMGG